MTAGASRFGDREYDAMIGAGLLDTVGATIAELLAGPRCVIITDGNVAPRFGDRVRKSVAAAGFQPGLIAIPPGERDKTLEQVADLRSVGGGRTGSAIVL